MSESEWRMGRRERKASPNFFLVFQSVFNFSCYPNETCKQRILLFRFFLSSPSSINLFLPPCTSYSLKRNRLDSHQMTQCLSCLGDHVNVSCQMTHWHDHLKNPGHINRYCFAIHIHCIVLLFWTFFQSSSFMGLSGCYFWPISLRKCRIQKVVRV